MVRKGSSVRVRHWACRRPGRAADAARPSACIRLGPGPELDPVRVAYLVTSHREPEQVLRLVRVLREQPGAEVFVRHDQRRAPLARAEIESAGGRMVQDGIDIEWGGWSYLQVLLGGLRAVARQADPDWVLVLSGQDYPLAHHAELEAFLAREGRDAHLADAWRLDPLALTGGPQDEFVLRYAYRHFRAPQRAREIRLPRRLAYTRAMPPPLPPLVGMRRARTPFRPGLRCHVSADWPTLSRRALRAVLELPGRHAKLMRHLRGSFAPSECFFATALMNDSGLTVGTGPHRYTRFPPGAPNPRTLTGHDLNAMLASGAHFARKFDRAVDSGVLDELDRLRADGSGRASLGRPWPAETFESP